MQSKKEVDDFFKNLDPCDIPNVFFMNDSNVIGDGSEGIVYKSKYTKKDRLKNIAIKVGDAIIPKGRDNTKGYDLPSEIKFNTIITNLMKERKLSKKYATMIYGAICKKTNKYFIIMPLYTTTLEKYLLQNKREALFLFEKSKIFVRECVEELFNNKIVVTDIHADNILVCVSHNKITKMVLGDFGSAIYSTNTELKEKSFKRFENVFMETFKNDV